MPNQLEDQIDRIYGGELKSEEIIGLYNEPNFFGSAVEWLSYSHRRINCITPLLDDLIFPPWLTINHLIQSMLTIFVILANAFFPDSRKKKNKRH